MRCPICGGEARQLNEDYYECLGPSTGSGYDICGQRFLAQDPPALVPKQPDISGDLAPPTRSPDAPDALRESFALAKSEQEGERARRQASELPENRADTTELEGIRQAQTAFLAATKRAGKKPERQRVHVTRPRRVRTGLIGSRIRYYAEPENLRLWHISLANGSLSRS